MNQMPQHSGPGMVNVAMVNQPRPGMMGNPQFTNQQIQGPPGYHNPTGKYNFCVL